MASTATEQWLALTKATDKKTDEEVKAVYDKLGPVSVERLVEGKDWIGGFIDTGHSGGEPLRQIGWVGKTFRDVDDVEPIMVTDKEGKRVASPTYGKAKLRKVEYRGVVSAAMIYDNHPIIDCFRTVNDKMIAGAMDLGEASRQKEGTFWFYLYRE